eukprot:10633754-Alexandrium_andersonii.AAC.1
MSRHKVPLRVRRALRAQPGIQSRSVRWHRQAWIRGVLAEEHRADMTGDRRGCARLDCVVCALA